MRELTKNKCFNEDIAALHVKKSEIVQENVPIQIVNGFCQSHQRLRVLNVTIQTSGWIMEESAYSNYEDPIDVQNTKGNVSKIWTSRRGQAKNAGIYRGKR